MSRPTMMASSSMSPLSRGVQPTANKTPPVETPAVGPLPAVTVVLDPVATQSPAPPPVQAAKPKKKSADDDEDKKDKDDEDDKDDDESKALAAGNDDRGDRAHIGIDVARHARECERGRLLAILDSEAGKAAFSANPERTLRFALTHPGTRLEAIATLELFGGNLQPAKAPPLRERMEGVRVEVGPDAANGGPSDDPSALLAARIVAAGRKARGEAA